MLAPKRPPASAARQQEILRAVATERLSLRAAERAFGVTRQIIAKWREKKLNLCRSRAEASAARWKRKGSWVAATS